MSFYETILISIYILFKTKIKMNWKQMHENERKVPTNHFSLLNPETRAEVSSSIFIRFLNN